jgi:hypothetical protein
MQINIEHWWNDTEVLGEKTFTVTICPPQIPHELTWDRKLASALRGGDRPLETV